MRHAASLTEAELLAECEVRRQRRSGPGGQHRNKVATGISLCHLPSGCTASAWERRDQRRNLASAIHRLRITLAVKTRSDVATLDADLPSELWRRRCHSRRIVVSPRHADFPSLLAEALDVLHSVSGDLSRAADRLEVSKTSLLQLLRKEPRALLALNALRRTAGLGEVR